MWSNSLRLLPILSILVMVTLLMGVQYEGASSHEGHPQKKLFDVRWYQEVDGNDYDSWMNLSTSETWFECGTTELSCASRWNVPIRNALLDWNGQNTTVEFDLKNDQNPLYDINIYALDLVFFDPGLFGVALPYNESFELCFESCTIWYGDVLLGDVAHELFAPTANDRRATSAHELGHHLALRHESVNDDESVLYDCGEDDTGPIPHSVMSYHCIDPAPLGLGEYWVQEWDVCGVNHAYYDPNIGFAECGTSAFTSTPTASPTPTPIGTRVWGDVNCSGDVEPNDVVAVLRHGSGLDVDSPAGCPSPDEQVNIDGGSEVAWGNVDCGLQVDFFDSLKILLDGAGVDVDQPAGCPDIGDVVVIQ